MTMAITLRERLSVDAVPRAGRIVAHLFVEPDGTLSVKPTVQIAPSDEAKLRAALQDIARWRSVDERLSAVLWSHVL
jgi:hypothetical protein